MLLPRVPQAAGTLRLRQQPIGVDFRQQAGIKSGPCGLAGLLCGLPGVIPGMERVGSDTASERGFLWSESQGARPFDSPAGQREAWRR